MNKEDMYPIYTQTLDRICNMLREKINADISWKIDDCNDGIFILIETPISSTRYDITYCELENILIERTGIIGYAEHVLREFKEKILDIYLNK